MHDISFFDWMLLVAVICWGIYIPKKMFLEGCRVGFERGWDAAEQYRHATLKAQEEWEKLHVKEDNNG